MPNPKTSDSVTRVLSGAVLCFTTLLAQAAPATDLAEIPPPSPTLRLADTLNLAQLERIQGETLLFEAQVARAKARMSLQQNNGDDVALPSPLTQTLLSPAPGVAAANPDIQPARKALPRIIEIAGSGKALRSRLALQDGTSVEVSTGQRIPGTGDIVKLISAQEVQILNAAGEVHTLAFTE